MCFSPEVSLIAWIFGAVGGYLLYKRGEKYDKWNAYFIWTFTFIQFLEFLLWLVVGKSDVFSRRINSIITFIVLVALLLQPLIQVWQYSIYNPNTINKILTYVFLFGAVAIPIVALMNKTQFITTVGEKGHLVWNGVLESMGNYTYLYLLGLLIPLLFMGTKGFVLFMIGVATFIYSYITTKGKEFSSMWCFTALFYVLAALF